MMEDTQTDESPYMPQPYKEQGTKSPLRHYKSNLRSNNKKAKKAIERTSLNIFNKTPTNIHYSGTLELITKFHESPSFDRSRSYDNSDLKNVLPDNSGCDIVNLRIEKVGLQNPESPARSNRVETKRVQITE
jgi:hypothetical protein